MCILYKSTVIHLISMTRLVTGSVNTHIIGMDAVYFSPVLTDTDYEIRVYVSGYITESIFSHSFSFTEYSISFHFFNIFELEIHSSRSEEHTSELQSRFDLVCRLLLEKKNN